MTCSNQKAPRLNANDDTLDIIEFHFADGSFAAQGASLLDVGTTKATVTLSSETAGYIVWQCEIGELVNVGSDLVHFYAEEKNAREAIAIRKSKLLLANQSTQDRVGFKKLTPQAEALASEMGLDTSTLTGLWSARHLKEKFREKGQSANLSMVHRSERVLKPKMFEIANLSWAQNGALSSSLTVEFSSAKILEALNAKNALGTSLLPLLLFEFAQLLPKFPKLTSFYDDGFIRYYDRTNLGIAMDSGQGLRVVTIFGADRLNQTQIAEALTDLTIKYLSEKLSVEEIQESTIAVSDLSSLKIRTFQPMLSRHQSAILGIGGDVDAEGKPISLTMTFDHRVLTGREVAEVLNLLKQNVLKYEKMDK